MLYMKFGKNPLHCFSGHVVWKCWWTDGWRTPAYTVSSPMSLRLRWLRWAKNQRVTPEKLDVIILKFKQFYPTVMCPNDAGGMANECSSWSDSPMSALFCLKTQDHYSISKFVFFQNGILPVFFYIWHYVDFLSNCIYCSNFIERSSTGCVWSHYLEIYSSITHKIWEVYNCKRK